MNDAHERRIGNFPRNLVPVLTVDDQEHELMTQSQAGSVRCTMQGLANYLGQLSGEEWVALRKLGAFKGDEATIRLVQSKLDDIMRLLLSVTSEREWSETGFSLEDLRNAAEIASSLAIACRDQARSQSSAIRELHQRIDKIEETQDGHEKDLEQVSHQTKDDPFLDATDGAHPAWWRGCDHGVKMTCEKLTRVAVGDHAGPPSFASEEMNALASKIIAMNASAEKDSYTVRILSDILTDLRVSTTLNHPKDEILTDEVWEDLNGIHQRLKSG